MRERPLHIGGGHMLVVVVVVDDAFVMALVRLEGEPIVAAARPRLQASHKCSRPRMGRSKSAVTLKPSAAARCVRWMALRLRPTLTPTPLPLLTSNQHPKSPPSPMDHVGLMRSISAHV